MVSRAGHQLVVLGDDLYAVGGVDSYDEALDSVEMYDADEDTWLLCQFPLKSNRSFFAAVGLPGNPPSSSCSVLWTYVMKHDYNMQWMYKNVWNGMYTKGG